MSVRLQRVALWLVGATIAFDVVEGGLGLWSGLSAGSVALTAFGLDSVIEIVAASAMLWRLRGGLRRSGETLLAELDQRVHRIIGVTFLALSAYILADAGFKLWTAAQPHHSTVGLVLAAVSVVVMPALAWAKTKVADRLGSRAMRAEARESLACSYLALSLLVGLALDAAFGFWWADPVAALLMVPFIVHEGLEGLEGEEEGEEEGDEDD